MVIWSDTPQPEIPPGEPAGALPTGMQQLGELLPAVLARHGLGVEPAAAPPAPAARSTAMPPVVLPQPECPAAT